MRFLLFNAIVGLALVYLFNGGTLSLNGLKNAVQDTAETAAAAMQCELQVADAPKPKAPASPAPASPSDGFAKDVIPTPEPPAPAPAPRRQSDTPPPPPPVPGAKLAEAEDGDDTLVAPLPLPAPQEVAVRPVHTADESKAVARRRGEVLAHGPATGDVALKEGTKLMSAAERRRQLDALAEEMEMLYLEKVGG